MSRVGPSTADSRSGGTIFEGDHPRQIFGPGGPFLRGIIHGVTVQLISVAQRTLLNTIYVVEIMHVFTVAGLKTDTLPDVKASAAPFASATTF